MAWKTGEAAAQAGASKEASVQFEELTSLLQSRSAEFGGELMRDGQIEEFSELYKEMDPFGKENMEFVVDRLRALEFCGTSRAGRRVYSRAFETITFKFAAST